MSRDRKQRAKQRRSRQADEGGSGELVRADLPGALDHASGDVDEFDAALVRGAGGVPQEAGQDVQPSDSGVEDREVPPPAGGGSRRGGGGGGNGSVGDDGDEAAFGRSPARRPSSDLSAPKRGIGSRAVAFLRASWAELQRVQWPDRPQVSQATAVVLGFVVVAGVYLGVADWVAQKIINFIL